jgi:hypothetical protein
VIGAPLFGSGTKRSSFSVRSALTRAIPSSTSAAKQYIESTTEHWVGSTDDPEVWDMVDLFARWTRFDHDVRVEKREAPFRRGAIKKAETRRVAVSLRETAPGGHECVGLAGIVGASLRNRQSALNPTTVSRLLDHLYLADLLVVCVAVRLREKRNA